MKTVEQELEYISKHSHLLESYHFGDLKERINKQLFEKKYGAYIVEGSIYGKTINRDCIFDSLSGDFEEMEKDLLKFVSLNFKDLDEYLLFNKCYYFFPYGSCSNFVRFEKMCGNNLIARGSNLFYARYQSLIGALFCAIKNDVPDYSIINNVSDKLTEATKKGETFLAAELDNITIKIYKNGKTVIKGLTKEQMEKCFYLENLCTKRLNRNIKG